MTNPAPYRVFSETLIERYGARTYRLTLTGGRTCPTRDGAFGPKRGWGGCTFCDVYGSASFHSDIRKHLPIEQQLEEAAAGVRLRFKAEKFIAYFQSYTTSYKEIEHYRQYFAAALAFPDVVALAVATRPDCLPDAFLEMLGAYLAKVDIMLELGVQSFHEPTLEWYGRGHDAQCSQATIARAQAFAMQARAQGMPGRLEVIVHMIIGSPLETDADLVQAAQTLNSLGVAGVKIHHLHILKKTKLAREFQRHPFPLPTLEEYENKVALFIRHLDPSIVIHRTHATAPRGDELIGPAWSHMRAYPSHKLRRTMQARGWQQGDLKKL